MTNIDRLAYYFQLAWAYVLREPVKVVLVLGLVVPVVLIGVNNLRESSRQRAVETELPQLVERIKKARVGSNLVLGEITGDYYSDGNAKCRKGQSLRSLADDDACIVGMTAQWQKLGFEMQADFDKQFGVQALEAYGPLLVDAMRGDQSLYKHRLEVEGGWVAVMPFLDAMSAPIRKSIASNYAQGSWGPAAADAMMARDGRVWHNE